MRHPRWRRLRQIAGFKDFQISLLALKNTKRLKTRILRASEQKGSNRWAHTDGEPPTLHGAGRPFSGVIWSENSSSDGGVRK